MILRQLFDPASWTYTYLLGDPESGEAVIIDSVFEQHRRDAALIRELGLKLVCALETHVHADHVTGAWLLREHTGCGIALSRDGGAEGADRLLDDGDVIEFGGRSVTAVATPGHTNSCMTYVLDDETKAFTGDTLLIRGCGRTDFQQGDPGKLYHSVRDKIFKLPNECELYPGHDYSGRTVTTVREELFFNPRLGNRTSEADFTGYMNNLNLPHPRQIDVAVPSNLRCGEPNADRAMPEKPSWGPVVFTFAGVWEINPLWVGEHRDEVQILDVRSAAEYDGELGHIESSKLVPLDELRDSLDDLDKNKPVVVVCQSGARSAQGALILQGADFPSVANLSGGMLRWPQLGMPVAQTAG